ncbi:MAG: hypothetical protein ACTSWC_12335 [Promethearchaeota archaeon]
MELHHFEERIFDLFSSEYHRFPQAEIRDYYKLLFQAVFGAEHMIPDKETCQHHLEMEMAMLRPRKDVPLYHDISLNVPLIRVNLTRCLAEKIPPSRIADIFFLGAKNFKQNQKVDMEKLVKSMINILKNEPFNFSEGELENFTEKLRQQEFPAVHHSKIYRILYQPHYRVIPLKLWDNLHH